MKEIIHYTSCPVCGSPALQSVMSVRDHSVSGETFQVLHCVACTARFTQDIPALSAIGPYYQSEDYISHTNTNRGLINRLYQLVRKRTIRQKRKLIRTVTGKEKGALLDLGSGTGAFAAEMKNAGWEVTGLEPDAGARKVAEESFGIHLEDTSSFYSLPDQQFDAITLWHVLEHVHDLQGYMKKMAASLRENGKLVIAVPNYTSGDAAKWGDCWAAWDVPRHLYHFSPASLEGLANRHGLKLEACKPMWYDSFYVSLLSSRYRYGSTRLLPAFLSGLHSNLRALRDIRKCSSVIYILGKK